MVVDTLSREGAETLRDLIVSYWFARGYDVKVDVRQEVLFGKSMFVVRSDMRDGMPVRRRR